MRARRSLSCIGSSAAVELTAGRRGTLKGALERALPASSDAAVVVALWGIGTLSSVGLLAEIGD
jgi:hypothetical protein